MTVDDLRNLPDELQLSIFSFLNPESLCSVRKVNRSLYHLLNGNSFWKKKFQQHFPHIFAKIRNEEINNWYEQFGQTYRSEYSNLSQSDKELFSLLKEEDFDGIKQAFSKDDKQLTKLNTKDKNKLSLLNWAQKIRNQTILNYFYTWIIENKSPPQDELLFWAIQCHQSLEQINKICHHEKFFNNENLLHCAEVGHLALVETLLINKQVGINVSTTRGNYTPLHIAAIAGHSPVVAALITKDAIKVNERSVFDMTNPYRLIEDVGKSTSLHLAAAVGQFEIVEILLNQKEIEMNAIDENKATPLHRAARYGHFEIVRKLIAKEEVNINAIDYLSRTPLHFAALYGHFKIAQVLLEKKDILFDFPNNLKRTPLHNAAEGGHLKIVCELLAKEGININAIDHRNFTPAKLAAENGFYDVEKVLQLISDLTTFINNAYQTSFTLFHRTVNFGYSVDEQKKAAKALYQVIINKQEASILNLHLGPLNQGELKSLMKRYQKYVTEINTEVQISNSQCRKTIRW